MNNPFQQMVAFADLSGEPRPLITQEEYTAWKREAVMDMLQGLRYGQSFCNRFGITDNLLYFSVTQSTDDEYIRKHYLAGS